MRSDRMDRLSGLLATFLPVLVAIILFNPVLGGASELQDAQPAEEILSARDTQVVISPTQGDQWPLRSRQFIRWSGFTSTLVRIDISYNEGTDWTFIADTSTFIGSYEWIVTEQTRLQRCNPTCTIRITERPGGLSAISGTFTIPDVSLMLARRSNGAVVDDQPIKSTEKLPLILIYGVRLKALGGGNETTWDGFLDYFVSQPALMQRFKPYIFLYDNLWSSSTTPIFDAGAQLRNLLHQKYQDSGPDGFADKPVVIVAHSMGGLVARSFMQNHWFPNGPQGGERVLRLISLATPHHGTPVANDPPALFDPDEWGDFVRDLRWDNYTYNPATASFAPNNWLRDLNCVPASSCPPPDGRRTFYEKVFAYAGDAGVTSVPYLIPFKEQLRDYGYPDNDGVVPVESAKLEAINIGKREVVPGCDHFEMADGSCGTAGQGLLASIAAALLSADNSTGTLLGRIQDQNGALIVAPGASCPGRSLDVKVRWTPLDSGGTPAGTTAPSQCNPDPYYSATLATGRYTVSLEVPAGWEVVGGNNVSVNITAGNKTHHWFAVRESGGTDPFGVLDAPSANATVTGPVSVAGWVLDQEDATLTVELLVDNQRVSSSPTRHARPDVCNAFPTITHCASSQPGFTFTWNTATVTNGAHTLAIRVTDPGGRNMSFGSRTVTVSNGGGGTTPGSFSVNAFGECSGNNPAIRLSWTISSNATSFEVYRNNALLVGSLPNSTDFYVDSSVSGGTTYNYFIRARNSAGSTDSNSVIFTAPTNCIFTLSAQPECSGTISQIRLKWSVPPTGAGSYEVFRNGVSIFSTFSATEYVDSGVTPGASYTYVVRASTSAGPRDSASVSATALSCGTVPPGQFTLTAASECFGSNPQIRLTWTASAGMDFYQVLRDGAVLDGVSGTTYLDTAVSVGTTYSYTIRAINSGGQTNSNTVSVTASCVTAPGPFTLSIIPTCSGTAPVNHLEWGGSAGRTLPYEVYRNGSLVFTTDFSQYDDAAVTAGITYNYIVRAKNSVGSTDSNTVQGTAKTDCAAPLVPVISSISQSSVTIGNGSFTLTVTGSNFDSTANILWAPSGQTPSTPAITPTFVNSSTLTVQVSQNSAGFSFPSGSSGFNINPGSIIFQVQKFFPSGDVRSNTVPFTIFNPVPVVSSITGTCRANLNCNPFNGFDVRIFGSGFVNNIAFVGGTFVSSTTLDINGAAANMNLMGQGPAYTQMQLLANGSLIPTPGTYTLRVCNAGTSQGTACSTGSLTVTP